MSETVIKVENLKKQYRLGMIGGGTLTADLQSWWAKKRGKEDPNTKIGETSGKYGESFYALKGISFEVKKGEALGIIGGNGAGKSTLLKILAQVTAPTEGEVYIKGRISSMLEVGTGFHAELTGRENIYLNGAILGMSKTEVDSKIEDIIEFSECRKFIDTPVKRYSSGMYVKLAFAVVAHLDSDIMIMDEVLAVGDMKFQEKCLGKMGDAANTEGKTVLYVSHNMNTIRQLCTRCIVLNQGKIVFDGDVEKAIEIYMGNIGKSPIYVELENQDRSEEFQMSYAKFISFRVLEKKMSTFSLGEKMECEVGFKGRKKSMNNAIRFIIRYADGTPVMMTTTEANLVVDTDIKKEKITIDISKLAPGKYSLNMVLYCVNQYGTDLAGDGVKDFFWFEIVDTEKEINHMEWTHQYWGHFYMGKAERNG